MKHNFLVIFFIALLVDVFNPVLCYSRELTIVYTANTSGKLNSCNCPHDPYGGLAERTTLIKQLRSQNIPFLLVDGGNMVSLFGAYDNRASCVLRLMNLMGYDAAGVGCQEMYHGEASAVKMIDTASFPLLSATIARQNGNSLIFKPYSISTVGELKIGITGLCDPESLEKIGKPKVEDFHFLSTNDAVKNTLDILSATCDFIVVLSDQPHEHNVQLLIDFPEIDLIVESFSNRKYDPPVTTSGGIIVSPGSRGQFAGSITLEKPKDNTVSVKRHEFLPVLYFSADEDALSIITEYTEKDLIY